MSATNANFVRTTFLMLIVGTIVLTGIILSSLWLVDRNQSTFAYIIEERDIRRAAADLLQTLVDAETGQRGFVDFAGDALEGNADLAKQLAPARAGRGQVDQGLVGHGRFTRGDRGGLD